MSLRATLIDKPGCLVIAEVGQAHDGSLGTAHAYIDAVAATGADAIKFQTHIAAAESTPAEPWRVQFSQQDESRYAYWQRMEFTTEQWAGLRKHSAEAGLLFLSSPFSEEAVDLLAEVGVAAWKVASGEVTNLPMLRRILREPEPVILSSGMSSYPELDRAVAEVGAAGRALAVLQCTTAYPCPAEQVGLNVLDEFRARYPDADVGLSDHTGTIWPAVAGAALGLDVLEVHVTLSRQSFGPDVHASLTMREVCRMIEGIRFIETMRASPVDKELEAHRLADVRALFAKSVVAARDLAESEVLDFTDFRYKKPGTGVPAAEAQRLVGQKLLVPVHRDHQILDEHVDGVD